MGRPITTIKKAAVQGQPLFLMNGEQADQSIRSRGAVSSRRDSNNVPLTFTVTMIG